jgi:hypothetical protein
MKFKCIKDFKMNTDEIAFIKGKVYNFTHSEGKSRPYETFEDEIDSSIHAMSLIEMKNHFVKIINPLKNINLRRIM